MNMVKRSRHRICECCGRPLIKDRRISLNAFKKRRFCCRSHAMKKLALGRKPSALNIQKLIEANSGSNSHLWKGGISSNRKEYFNMKGLERYARLKGAKGSFTVQEWLDLKAKYNYRCAHCGRHEVEAKLTKDHIIPLTKGGSNSIDNIKPLCQSCNSRKYNKIIV